MKMSKIKIAVLVSLATSIVVFPIIFTAYKEFYVKPFLLSTPAWMRGYVNYQPFFSTWYGISTIMVWACLGFVWLFYAIVMLVKKLKTQASGESVGGV